MNKFSIDLVGDHALQINFIKPYPEDIVAQINSALESIEAKMESRHHNTYVDEYYWWYSCKDGRFTFTDHWGDYNIYAQGNNVLIKVIAKALVESGKFEQK
ncbi:MAG: hypothetical protein GY810_08895 [Aureispira sp.]|nr:hypothetical protein [Aureispira sp.]